MSTLRNTPIFRRVFADHMVRGVTRVWWELQPTFNDPLPYQCTLEVGNTPSNLSNDWKPVGPPVVNTLYADDTQQEAYGRELTVHYRVKLVTALGTYISPPCPVFGLLPEKDWLFAAEICRKEQLRHKLVSRPGYLLKRLRFGIRCTYCTDTTGAVTDSRCPECNGVGYKTGYHPPIPMALFDVEPTGQAAIRNSANPGGPEDPTATTTARTLGFPIPNSEDVWVDARSDERYFIGVVQFGATWRGVPLVTKTELKLAPFSDRVYRLEVGGESGESRVQQLPTAGDGTVRVDHDYGGTDALQYTSTPDGCGIVGAQILAIPRTDYDAGLRTADHACAASATTANGRWAFAMLLEPGEYMLVFQKDGAYGPDAVPLTVTAPSPADSLSSVSSMIG